MATIVLGVQWGDEGKGKLIDALLAGDSNFRLCCRAAGGDNAGHTVVVKGTTYDFHIIPSGLLSPNCINLIGSGTVVNIPSFFRELKKLQDGGLDTDGRLFISDRAHVVFDLHQLADRLEEEELGKGNIGTTKRGIGPCYSTKAARSGARIGDIFDKEILEHKLRTIHHTFEQRYGKEQLKGYSVNEEIARFDTYRETLASFVVDQVPLIASAQESNQPILVEGANALLLDIDAGTYPMVTSSNTGLGGCFTGLSISPFKLKDIVGVVKAYTTRVGSGPFPTEQADNEIGKTLQSVGHEVGVTSGRPRRCGWFDLVLAKYSTHINHYTAFNLTKLDVLDAFDEIQVCTAYKVGGEEVPSFPAGLKMLETLECTYETLPGWGGKLGGKTAGCKRWDDLPENARKYVEWIERSTGVKVRWIGTGPAREDLIVR
ncbi:adenylosuccinate synthetase-like protein [Rhizodiscina lignyota]|uniref:Adenylosuccinate synthetase n=1 Tax=Rhizodiscina lignyota TaxID=1504668 RepID=A0A9P4M0S1_9PEZI|nr:adenylosuccinate synthetase-like protein [Rhizodiscina lignyota]